MGCTQMGASGDPKSVREVLKADPPLKLLSLGLGDSGKSTFNRQIALMHSALDMSSLHNCGVALQENTLQSMQSLLKFAQQKKMVLPLDLESMADEVLCAEYLLPDAAKAIEQLWEEETLRDLYYHKGHECTHMTLPSAASYYFQNAVRFAEEDFSPEPEDIPYVKLRTTGVYTIAFKVNGATITITDVGGQRCERRKWIHCFDNVTAVLYFCAIGEYNMSIEEDDTVNRLDESLRVFQEVVCDTPYFKNSAIILFLNKSDLFRERIKADSLANYMSGISEEDGKEFDTAVQFIREKFYSVLPKTMKMRAHVTCAVHKEDCERVFVALQTKLLSSHLSKMGL